MKAFLLVLPSIMAVTFSLTGVIPALGAGQPAVVDVALGERGTLAGQVVDAQGVGGAERLVALMRGNGEISRATTDGCGYFSIENVRSGVYQLVADDSTIVLRAWAAGTAPPIAQYGVLVVSGEDVYRGQQAVRSVRNFLAHPVTVVGVVATGIAVPVALYHSRRRSPASPE